jgi:hypothetical protein
MGILGAALAALISYGFNSVAYAFLTVRLVGGRYKGYEIIMALFCFPMVAVTLLHLSPIIRILTFSLELVGMLWWSHRHGIFDTADLFFLEHLSIPRLLRRTIYTLFVWLEPPEKALNRVEP